MNHKLLKRSALALAVVAAASGGGYLAERAGTGRAHAAPAPVVAAPATPSVALPDFESIIARVGPAVVNVSVQGTVRQAGGMASPFGQVDPGDPLAPFLRRFGPQFQMPPGERMVRGQGSGFIVSPDGVILTNAHVVDQADTVTVKLTDKREFTAKVVGVDTLSDVAVLKIDASGLPTLPIGDPDATRVGEWVLAIGSPFGFENSVTAGIVSAKSRSLPDEGYVPFIQTDVAINPGNSGGPLLNLRGEVVGINSQIYSRSGGYQGISFAIPIDVATQVKDQLLADGKVTRGRIGVAIQDLNQALADAFGLESARGALVTQVEPGSPGAEAGLQSGDVILALDGAPIRDSGQLPPQVAAMKPGTDITLQVWRKGDTRTLKVTVGQMPAGDALARADDAAEPGRLGVSVRPLSEAERDQAQVDHGLLVGAVSGAAERAGILPGDVLLSLDGQPLTSVEQLRNGVDGRQHHVALLVQRQNVRLFVPVDLG
jgi:serine protease Do